MKKVLLGLACVAFMAASLTSCDKKTCTCEAKVAGVASAKEEVTLEELGVDKCKDANFSETVLGVETSLKCK